MCCIHTALLKKELRAVLYFYKYILTAALFELEDSVAVVAILKVKLRQLTVFCYLEDLSTHPFLLKGLFSSENWPQTCR